MAKLRENIRPALVLTVICLVVTAILACTQAATAPLIAAGKKAAADQARSEVLTAADSFAEVADIALLSGVSEVYRAENGQGYVITTAAKGYGGLLTVMTGFDAAGAICGVQIIDHEETPGLGTKAMTAAHLTQYLGRSELDQLDAISGATVSSKAIHLAVELALAQYQALGGMQP